MVHFSLASTHATGCNIRCEEVIRFSFCICHMFHHSYSSGWVNISNGDGTSSSELLGEEVSDCPAHDL